jgi:hypothetical protein
MLCAGRIGTRDCLAQGGPEVDRHEMHYPDGRRSVDGEPAPQFTWLEADNLPWLMFAGG